MSSNDQKIEKEEGIVDFWSEIDQYVINLPVTGTIDSMRTGIVEELPEAFRAPGTKVIVSGTLSKTPDLPAPRMGGQSIYRLEISDIEKAGN